MKILHIIAGISKAAGGPTYALENILKVENLLGYHSTVVALKGSDSLDSIMEVAAVDLFPPSFPKRFSRSRKACRWLSDELRRFDLVLLHGIWSLFLTDSVRILTRGQVPYVVMPHGSLDPFDLAKKKALKLIAGPLVVRPLLAGSKAVHCTASIEAERLVTFGGKCNIRVLPLPVSAASVRGDRLRFREHYAIGSEDFVFLFLSRLDYKKGLDLLVPALEEIRRQYPTVKLVIAGGDSHGYKGRVIEWVNKHRLGDAVLFCGFLSGVAKEDAFAGSDCFVLPSLNENFGVAILEAISAGLPAIISKNVYIANDIMDCSWICDNTVESLAASMSDVLSQNALYRQKKSETSNVAKKFLPATLAPLYRAAYEKAIS